MVGNRGFAIKVLTRQPAETAGSFGQAVKPQYATGIFRLSVRIQIQIIKKAQYELDCFYGGQ